MRHIRTYNESSGQTWRQVGRDEMARLMRGEVDTFTKAEVSGILDLLTSKHLNGILQEFNSPAKTLNVDLFLQNWRNLRVHTFGKDIRVKVIHPRLPSNNIFITFFIDYIDIYKSTDDYFYVCKGGRGTRDSLVEGDYVCDGISGLISVLTKILESENR